MCRFMQLMLPCGGPGPDVRDFLVQDNIFYGINPNYCALPVTPVSGSHLI